MKKNKLVLLQLVIAFVLISTSVYAAFNTTIALSVSDAKAFRGDTVDVTLSLEGVEADKVIQSVEGYINYNSDIIEAINVDSIQKADDNTVTIGGEKLKVEDLTNADVNKIPTSTAYVAFNGSPVTDNDSKIVIDFKEGISEDTELLTVRFKVKETAEIGEVENAISYSMFVMTSGSEKTEEITKNVKVTVQAVPGTEDDSNTNNSVENKVENETENEVKNESKNEVKNEVKNETKNEVKNESKNTNTNTNKNTNQNTNKNSNNVVNSADNTVSSVGIPAAGAKVILIPAIILVILAYVSYNRYMKYKNI